MLAIKYQQNELFAKPQLNYNNCICFQLATQIPVAPVNCNLNMVDIYWQNLPQLLYNSFMVVGWWQRPHYKSHNFLNRLQSLRTNWEQEIWPSNHKLEQRWYSKPRLWEVLSNSRIWNEVSKTYEFMLDEDLIPPPWLHQEKRKRNKLDHKDHV